MAKLIETNKYLADEKTRIAMIHRNVIESSIFEGIYHVTVEDLEKARLALVKQPKKKTK